MNKMSFRDFTFRNNPEKIRLVYSKKLKTFRPPNSAAVVQNLGDDLRIVSGSGEFFGEEAFSDFFALADEFAKKDCGVLTLPGFDAFTAQFKNLELVGNGGDGTVGYKFEFWEVPGEVKETAKNSKYTVVGTESLWDVSAATGVSLQSLLSLNPGIRSPFDLCEGQEVRLK